MTRVTKIFEDKVGNCFSRDQLSEIYRKGEERYKSKIPPGYKDASKDGYQKFGDLVMWLQMIEQSRATNKPLVFVTGDVKEDWWERVQGKLIGPLPQLREEFRMESDQHFYMYQSERFLEFALKFLKIEPEEKVIEEVKEVAGKRQTAADLLRPLFRHTRWFDDLKISPAQLSEAASYQFRPRKLTDPKVFAELTKQLEEAQRVLDRSAWKAESADEGAKEKQSSEDPVTGSRGKSSE